MANAVMMFRVLGYADDHPHMVTARDAVDDRVTGLDAGADDYLVKPFAMPELLARLRALNRRPAGAQSDVLTLADLELDTRTHQARRAGQPIDLTTKEFAVLAILMRHPEQVLSRDIIIERAVVDCGAEQVLTNLKICPCGLSELAHQPRDPGW